MAETSVSPQMPEPSNLSPRVPRPGVTLDEELCIIFNEIFHTQKSLENIKNTCVPTKKLKKQTT